MYSYGANLIVFKMNYVDKQFFSHKENQLVKFNYIQMSNYDLKKMVL